MHLSQSNNRAFIDRLMCYPFFSQTQLVQIPVHITTTLADERLSYSSNVDMKYTTKNKVRATDANLSRRQHRVSLVGHVALVTARHFTNFYVQQRPVHLKPLERKRNASSGVFQNCVVLNDNNCNTFSIKIECHKLFSEKSAHSTPGVFSE